MVRPVAAGARFAAPQASQGPCEIVNRDQIEPAPQMLSRRELVKLVIHFTHEKHDPGQLCVQYAGRCYRLLDIMEVTCTRCHQPVLADNCYCPACGLPQLVYSADGDNVATSPERWPEAARDASSIDWKPGMRAALVLAVPAGLLSSGVSPLGALGLFWMAGAAAWAVVLYLRSQRPAWITTGAGARLGLVTGLIAGWLAFGFSGAQLFVARAVLHQGDKIDTAWRENVDKSQQLGQQWLAQMKFPNEAEEATAQRNWMLSPEGHAGFQTLGMAWSCSLLVLFAVGGGALGARMTAKKRRQV